MNDIFLVGGLRTAFARVDGPFAHLDAIALSVPVAQKIAAQAKGKIDFGVWGSVIPSLGVSNIAREVWMDAGLDPHVPTFSTIMACSTSMMGAFEAARLLDGKTRALALVGGAEAMSRVQVGLSQNLSDWLRRFSQAKTFSQKLRYLAALKPSDVHLHVPAIKNRTTKKSMGEHCEEMAKTWHITREEEDQLALESHQRAVRGQDTGFFADLIVPVNGAGKDMFPRRETSLEKLAKLKPAFARSPAGTITAGNSSPLTDGAAALWVANEEGLSRLPQELPRARLLDFEIAAVDFRTEGLLMAPARAIPRLLERHDLAYDDIALWELHEAFSAQIACHLHALEDESYLREQAKTTKKFGKVPVARMNPKGGSVALGHPFAATGARILAQAVKELAALEKGAKAIVSICADGGLGTVALLERA